MIIRKIIGINEVTNVSLEKSRKFSNINIPMKMKMANLYNLFLLLLFVAQSFFVEVPMARERKNIPSNRNANEET